MRLDKPVRIDVLLVIAMQQITYRRLLNQLAKLDEEIFNE